MEQQKSRLTDLLCETNESEFLSREAIGRIVDKLYTDIGEQRFSRLVDFYTVNKAWADEAVSRFATPQAMELIAELNIDPDISDPEIANRFEKIAYRAIRRLETPYIALYSSFKKELSTS